MTDNSSAITSLDDAINAFRLYCEGNGAFDELDLKEWLVDTWLTERFIARSRAKNGWNAKGWKI